MLKKFELAKINAIEEVHAHYMFSRVQVMKKISGNPFGAASRIIHGRYCSALQNPNSALLNRAGGYRELDELELDDVISWYKNQKVTSKITVIPEFHSVSFLELLKAKGFRLSKMWNTAELSGLASSIAVAGPPKQIRISEPKNKKELDTFASIYIESFNFPVKLKDGMRENIKRLSTDPHTNLYIGYLNAEPASVGVLHTFEKSGYLAMTGTLKKFRAQGIHAALINHRIKEAKKANVRLISGSASVGSTSQKNMERSGLKLSHIQQTWVLG